MRIISGKSRGTKIDTINSESTRPTLDRVKESLFNIIQNDIKDKIVLDLFAGSGALGLEALSRGARQCIFCDNNPKATEIIKSNLRKTKLEKDAVVYNCDYKKCIKKISNDLKKMDIVFIDPPYKNDTAIKSILELMNHNVLNTGAIIIIETDEVDREKKEINTCSKLNIKDERKYGRASLLFVSLNEEN